MIRHSIALKYARALIQIDKNYKSDFIYLFTLFQHHPKLVKILESPLFSDEEKEDLLKTALSTSLDAYFLRFLCYVMKKRGIKSLYDIFVEYEILDASGQGSWKAELVTGIALQPNTKRILLDKLEQYYNRKIDCQEKVDPQILGGTLFILGNKQIDWSLKNRVQKLKTHLLGIDICR